MNKQGHLVHPPLKQVNFYSAEAATELLDQWQDLITRCDNKNPFYFPDMLLPAWRCFSEDNLQLLTYFHQDNLVAVIPLKRHQKFGPFPIAHWQLWRYEHCFSCAPLIAAGHESSVLDALLQFIGKQRVIGSLFSNYTIPADSSVWDQLQAASCTKTASSSQSEFLVRACLNPQRTNGKSFRHHIKKKRSKEYRRLSNRLSENGCVHFIVHPPGKECEQRIDTFLRLEQSSWKGKNQSALLSTPANQEFVETALRQMARNHLLQVYELSLDDRPLATLLAFIAGKELYLFKITHNDDYEQYSPGVLLMLHCSDYWENEKNFAMIDSCAEPNHPMIDRVWYERRKIAKIHIATNGLYPRAVILCSKIIHFFQKPEIKNEPAIQN